MAHTAKSLQEAFHYLWPNEVTALQDLARSLPADPVIVNIGAGAGTSGLAFAESRRDLTLYTVDIQSESSPFGCLEAEKTVLREAGFDVDSYHTRFHQYCYPSIHLGKAWLKPFGIYQEPSGEVNHGIGQKLVDMVFVDGEHSYEGCKGDIEAWLPNIKPGGLLVIHDYDKAEVYSRPHNPAEVPHFKPWPGVDQAVQEFMATCSDKTEMVMNVDTLIAFRVNL